ncbi:DUF2268 domain-containing protein [Rossellomorea sp. BNER]|uniref:DUF2268 domain-containing protein n=1 Tax=Rossellomorea sp. BNER TaxID=2962031 RepID=UPI003AF26434|nr:DUF2268 domain-containing protein [Rossellomorea sp. BNER]
MRQLLTPIIYILLLLLLASCSHVSNQDQKDKDNVPSQKSIKFSHNEQTFQIIPLYEEVLNYTSLVKDNPSLNNKEKYFDEVLEPFQKKASMKNININNDYFSLFLPTKNVQKLEENTIELLKQQDQINEFIKESLIQSSKKLSGIDKTIFIMPLNPENTFPVQNMEGVSGATLSENAVLLQIDPSFVKSALKYAVAHEYHHTIRMESDSGKSPNLLDSFIMEGEAEVFARMIYPDKKAPWEQKPLSDKLLDRVLDELRENANSTTLNIYYDFVIGNSSKGIPMWANYIVGHKITQSYVENNPEVSIEEWTKLGAKEILQGSEYRDLLKEG